MRRLVDLAIGVPALLILAPALGLLVLAIRLESRGPGIFRQVRVGRNGIPFTMYKLRTMRTADAGANIVMGGVHDLRTTRLGRLLRRLRLDELPQLINVVTGEMTLIGPRPEVPQFVALYSPVQREVLMVRPGITGPGQLEYSRRFEQLLDGAADPNQVYVEQILGPKLAIDLEYLRTRSLLGDLRLVARTIRAMALPQRGERQL